MIRNVGNTTSYHPSLHAEEKQESSREPSPDSNDGGDSRTNVEVKYQKIMTTLTQELEVKEAYNRSLVERQFALQERANQVAGGYPPAQSGVSHPHQAMELANITYQQEKLNELKQRLDGSIEWQKGNIDYIDELSSEDIQAMRFHEREPTKYDRSYHVFFQSDNKIEELFNDDLVYRGHHEEQKGIGHRSAHAVNIESLDNRAAMLDPQLHAQFSAIPVGEDAIIESVGHTKVALEIHGDDDGDLSVNSGITGEYTAVDAEKIGEFLALNLRQGDYANKLTIALRACHGGLGNDDSSLKAIAKILEGNNYHGIKLTGSISEIKIHSEATGIHAMGATLTNDTPHIYNKFSTSDDKVEIRLPTQMY